MQTTKEIAKEIYNLFWNETSNLHTAPAFDQLPPMYIDAWCNIVKHLETKFNTNDPHPQIVLPEGMDIVKVNLPSYMEVFTREGLKVGFTIDQLNLLALTFTLK
jgi:hypothetical protein